MRISVQPLAKALVRVLVIATTALFLSACVTNDPYTGEQKTSNTAKGAGIGALTGAILGAATASDKDRNKGILQGALAGAAIGGGVGYYMDKQEARLREKLKGSGVQVKREGDTLHLIMPGNITFDTGKYDVRSKFVPVLSSVADVLKEFDKTAITVSGHTDSRGSDEFNQQLSLSRAANIKDVLTRQGVALRRVNAVGYGERYPVASNDTAEGRQQNRRVELKLTHM